MYFKHLKVRTEERTLHISALFDRSMPDTTVGYGEASILGLKGGRACHRVTTVDGKKEMSYAWYNVPLLNMGGRTKQVKASGVMARLVSRTEDRTERSTVTLQERPRDLPGSGSVST